MGGKTTKRERKFQASGGIEKRLKKGTVAKKRKIRKRNKPSDKEPNKTATKTKSNEDTRESSDDLISGTENLKDLDIDSFFSQFNEAVNNLKDDDDDEDEESPSPKASKAKQTTKKQKESTSDDEDDDDSDEEREDVKATGKKQKPSKQKKQDQDNESESASSDSDSDDEDVEAAEARMRKDMAKLESDDPEFHKFLKSNEQSLLEFGSEGEESEDDNDDDDGDMEDGDDEGDKAEPPVEAIELTLKSLQALEQGTFRSHGIKSFKKLVAAYKSACHLGDTAQGDKVKAGPGESGKSFVIDSSKIFDQLMVLCLNRCHEAFAYHLLGKDRTSDDKGDDDEDAVPVLEDNKPLNPRTLENSENWAAVRPILQSFFRSTLHLMSEAKEPEQLALILDSLSKYLRFLTPFPRLAEAMLKSLVSLWSASIDDEDYQIVRVKAFVRIRQLALTQPFPFIESSLKKCYLAYAKCAKFGGSSSVASALPTLTFMGNCLVELYSLDYHSSYQHAFVYIRQLALLLRSALQKKTPEAFQQVYCWQYIFCLKLWVAILAAAAPQDDGALMSSLIYPLTEVILGVTRSCPSPSRHLPLRFHCIRLLQQLAASSETYIPTTLQLLDILNQKEWHMKPKKSRNNDARGLQMHLLLKLSKDDCLRTHEQLEACMTELFSLLQRELELYRYSAGFPEYSVLIVQSLKKFNKDIRSPRWKTFARGCLDTCERYSTFAVAARSKLAEAPKDVHRLECLRSVNEPTMLERHKASTDKEWKLLEASKPAPSKKNKTNKEDDDESDNDAEDAEDERPKKKRKKKKKASKSIAQLATDDQVPGLMAQQDEVKEGIDWSDDE